MTHPAVGAAGPRAPAGQVRVALDVLGADHTPSAVVDGALIVAEERPDVALTLVGPRLLVEELLAERNAGHLLAGVLEVAPAQQSIARAEDPAVAVRASRDATVRVAARLVRDGAVDAMVSVGPTGAVLAAAQFTLGRLPGVVAPALAAVVPARERPVVLLDVGSPTEATADRLAQLGVSGAAYACAVLGIERPRVGLLSCGVEARQGDRLRQVAAVALRSGGCDLPTELQLDYVGNVEGWDVARGGPADVVVTDGCTGGILLSALAGASGDPDRLGGAVLLGLDGVVVVGQHAGLPRAAGPREVASCVAVAAHAVTAGLVGQVRSALAYLVARRRSAAGLVASAGG